MSNKSMNGTARRSMQIVLRLGPPAPGTKHFQANERSVQGHPMTAFGVVSG